MAQGLGLHGLRINVEKPEVIMGGRETKEDIKITEVTGTILTKSEAFVIWDLWPAKKEDAKTMSRT